MTSTRGIEYIPLQNIVLLWLVGGVSNNKRTTDDILYPPVQTYFISLAGNFPASSSFTSMSQDNNNNNNEHSSLVLPPESAHYRTCYTYLQPRTTPLFLRPPFPNRERKPIRRQLMLAAEWK